MDTPSPALLLAGEAAAVIAALRSNLKFNRYVRGAGRGLGPLDRDRWPLAQQTRSLPLQAQEEELEDPLVEEFKALRRKLFAWQSEGGGGRRRVAAGGGAAAAAAPRPLLSHPPALPTARLGRGGPAGVPDALFGDGQEP